MGNKTRGAIWLLTTAAWVVGAVAQAHMGRYGMVVVFGVLAISSGVLVWLHFSDKS